MITIDGKTYKAEWVADSFKRRSDILNGENTGRLYGTGAMFLEYVGTFFNFSGDLIKTQGCTNEEWEELYVHLSNPKNDHIVQLPFGKGKMEVSVYISSVEQKLKRITKDTSKQTGLGENVWDKLLSVSFTSIDSEWRYGDIMKEVMPYD